MGKRAAVRKGKPKAAKKPKVSEAISSDDEAAPEQEAQAEVDAEQELETADEKRVRLAKEYLAEVGEKVGLEQRLENDVAFEKGHLAHGLASSFRPAETVFYRGHKRPVTCVCLAHDVPGMAFSGAKDCAVVQWDLETGATTRKVVFPGRRNDLESGGHFAYVLGVTAAPNGQTVASVGMDRLVRLWDTRQRKVALTLRGHDGQVNACVLDGDELYTASHDRTIKVWSLGMQACTDTLFGHTGPVTSLDMFQENKLVSGGDDKTTRVWKTRQGTHLLYSHHHGSVDAVCAIDQSKFASFGCDGQLVVLGTQSKRALARRPACHGEAVGGPRWGTAIASLRLSDVLVSGSDDGRLRFWGTAKDGKKLSLEPLSDVSAPGYVNAIAVAKSGRLAVCALGTEHKTGRWERHRGVKDGLLVVQCEHDGPAVLY